MMSQLGPLAALLALASQPPATPEPPRGTGDSILGTAEEFSVDGPARVCLIHTSVDLRPGERAYLDYLGIHWGAFRVTGPNGTFHVREGNNWAEPKGGRLVDDLRGRAVERHRREGMRYLIYGPSRYWPDEERPLVWVEGDALGRSRDLNILARINERQNDPETCGRRYVYGWGVILGEPEGE